MEVPFLAAEDQMPVHDAFASGLAGTGDEMPSPTKSQQALGRVVFTRWAVAAQPNANKRLDDLSQESKKIFLGPLLAFVAECGV